ncbi:hypothetical protein OAX97_00490 [Gammaproteobacteria bacterium]|nr:hypothetical protein [Gammaproteobacteria bacterium]
MKKLFSLIFISVFSLTLMSAHHEGGHEKVAKKFENNFAYMSTYTMPAGSYADRIAKSLLENVKSLEEDGYNVCGLLRHQFGSDRAFYSYCYFDSWEQFSKINDNAEPASREPKQLYGNHSDNLLAIMEKNLTKRTQYILMATYEFAPYLTDNEKRANANILFSAYDRAFEGCNLMEHFWGPEQAWYFVCGYQSYADFGQKTSALGEIHENELADLKLDVLKHSDDLMVRVE